MAPHLILLTRKENGMRWYFTMVNYLKRIRSVFFSIIFGISQFQAKQLYCIFALLHFIFPSATRKPKMRVNQTMCANQQFCPHVQLCSRRKCNTRALSVDLFFFYFHFVASPPLNFWRQNHTHSQSASSRSFFQFTTRRRIPMPILMNILIMVLVYLVFFIWSSEREKKRVHMHNSVDCSHYPLIIDQHLHVITFVQAYGLFNSPYAPNSNCNCACAHTLSFTQSAIVRIDCDIVWEKQKIHFFQNNRHLKS